jgi:hypothetical protein
MREKPAVSWFFLLERNMANPRPIQKGDSHTKSVFYNILSFAETIGTIIIRIK